jgi:hypothetical protein
MRSRDYPCYPRLSMLSRGCSVVVAEPPMKKWSSSPCTVSSLASAYLPCYFSTIVGLFILGRVRAGLVIRA